MDTTILVVVFIECLQNIVNLFKIVNLCCVIMVLKHVRASKRLVLSARNVGVNSCGTATSDIYIYV